MEKQKKKVKQPKEKVKRSKKKVKQNEISQKESRKRKLRTALLMGFAAPVIFIFSLGFISYNLASDAMIKNYESSSNDILEANARYMESIFEEVATQSIKIITNKNFDYYYNGKSDDMFENLEYMRNLKNDVMTNSVLIDGIRSMYILSNNRAPIVTGNDQIQNSPYELFTSTDLIAGESKKDGWYGSHSAIDAKEKRGMGYPTLRKR